jgi:hypothetical protein
MAIAYATYADVKSRAGRIASAFEQAGKHPDSNDIAQFLVDVDSEIDAALRGRGFDPTTLDAATVAAFKDPAAYGALARALAGLTGAPADLVATANKIWTEAILAIENGTFPALRQLAASTAGDNAGSFWTDEPGYGMGLSTSAIERQGLNPDMAPAVARTQKL